MVSECGLLQVNLRGYTTLQWRQDFVDVLLFAQIIRCLERKIMPYMMICLMARNISGSVRRFAVITVLILLTLTLGFSLANQEIPPSHLKKLK